MTKKNLYLLPVAVILILGLSGFILKNSQTKQSTVKKENAEQLAKPLSQKIINKTYNFSTKDKNKKEIVLKLNIISAKKVKLISKKGQPYKAQPGEVFLVLSLELQNDSSLPLKVNSANFVRYVGEEDKKFAPDFYNGPVEVLPISVKKDEIAFIIPDLSNIKLQIGDINTPKNDLEIEF